MGIALSKKKEEKMAKYWFEQALKYKDKLPDKGERVLKWLEELEEK